MVSIEDKSVGRMSTFPHQRRLFSNGQHSSRCHEIQSHVVVAVGEVEAEPTYMVDLPYRNGIFLLFEIRSDSIMSL